MNHSDFFKLIRNGLPSGAFVLHGEEEYVKEQAVRLCEDRIEADLRPFNVAVLSKPSVQELSESCETLPLFIDRRIVVMREIADGAEAAKYVGCFGSVPDETLLLAVFKGKLAANSSVLKYAQASGREVLFERLSPTERAKWSIKHMGERGVVLPQDSAQLLVRMVGDDMASMVSETDKLADYVGEGGVVSPQDVSVLIKAALDVRIFDMLDMFTYGKPGDGVAALHALMDEGNEPMSISAFLVSRFKLMLEARRGIDSGKQKRDVVTSMEGSSYANGKLYDAARRFTRDELLGLIRDLSDTAYQKISGSVKEESYLELVLLKHDWRQFPV